MSECSPCFPSEDRVCSSDFDALISSIFPVVCVEIFPSQQAVCYNFFFNYLELHLFPLLDLSSCNRKRDLIVLIAVQTK